MPVIETSQARSITAADKETHLAYTGAGATWRFEHPLPDFSAEVVNAGTGSLTLAPDDGQINRRSTIVLPPRAGGRLMSDGNEWWFFGNQSRTIVSGTHTVTSGEDTANTCSIASGLTTVSAINVMILRAGAVVTGDAAVSVSIGTVTVANGDTYVLTAGDVIHWMVAG